MSVNEGTIDRLVRIIVGLVLLAMTPTIGGMIGAPLGAPLGNLAWIGVVPLLTGLIGWCPAYTLLGVNTCSR
jgi:hypothetical protein